MPINVVDLLRGRALLRGVQPPVPVAVVTMELQRGVMGDLASFPQLGDAARARGVPENAGRLTAAARELSLPVIHCTAAFRPDRAGTIVNTPLHAAVLRNDEHLIEGTPFVELIPELKLAEGDLVIQRYHGVSPFLGTSLDATLRNLGISTLVVTGVSLNLGVLGLCIEAANLGYQILLATDAVCGVPAEYGDVILNETYSLIATLLPTSEVITALHTAVGSQTDIV